MRIPERQCIGCGRRGPQESLVRLSLTEEGGAARVVVADRRRHRGRSAYLCEREACLERALARRAFQRAFRRSVEVDRESLLSGMKGSMSEGPHGSERR